jgi:hypothetical protein
MLREFAGVDLSRSFVLFWELVSETVMIDVDLFLTPEHPFYEEPRPAEKVCIRPAVIEFPFCESVASDSAAADAMASGVVADLGHGAITGLCRLANGHYEIKGDFGVVRIDAERPILKLKSP